MDNLKILNEVPNQAYHIKNFDLLDDISVSVLSKEVIALEFPSFTDGRAFSQARKLRRHGFTGDLIATGDVKVDQSRQLAKVGFSAICADNELDEVVIRDEIKRYPVQYQKSSLNAETVFERRLSQDQAGRLSGGGAFHITQDGQV